MDVQRRTVSRHRCGNDGNDEPKGTRETILFLKTLLYRSFVGLIKTLFRILRFISNLYMRIKRSSRTNTLLYRPTQRATCNYCKIHASSVVLRTGVPYGNMEYSSADA